MDIKAMGERIRKRRLELELSQQELAELIGVSTNFVGQIERANRSISIETFYNISDKLKISADYLLFGFDITKMDFKQLVNLYDDKSIKTKEIAIELLKTIFMRME